MQKLQTVNAETLLYAVSYTHLDVYKRQDLHRREDLCKIYNERFNSIRPREYDGSHIQFVGMNPRCV